jgi:two-component system alkaline phosphatase synthesis response regulator PhoP
MAKILFVEDEEDIAETGKLLLSAKGYTVDVATDGLTAVEKVYEDRPDLVILDISIPEMDGYQVCRVIKGDPEYCNIPIIMLTARTLQSDRFRGKETGADEYITKPYDPKQLVETVEKFIKDEEG